MAGCLAVFVLVLLMMLAMAGYAGLPIVAMACLALAMDRVPREPSGAAAVTLTIVRAAVYVVCWLLAAGLARNLILLVGVVDFSIARRDIRAPALVACAWLTGAYEITAALLRYVADPTSTAFNPEGQRVYGEIMLRGLLGYAVAALITWLNVYHDKPAGVTSQTRGVKAVRFGALGVTSIWLIVPFCYLVAGTLMGSAEAVRPTATLPERAWGLCGFLVCSTGTLLAFGVFDFAVLDSAKLSWTYSYFR